MFEEDRDSTESAEGPPLQGELANRYELKKELETTAFSQVLLVYDRNLRRDAVLKFLRRHTLFEHLERFKREAQIVASLRHPGIVRMYDYGVDRGRPYMVMEYIEGMSLDIFAARLQMVGQERLRIRRIVEICCELCVALEYLHDQGVVHRDIKPANVIVDLGGRPKLIDFGIARRIQGREGVTLEGEMIGTLVYMSPEQTEGGSGPSDRRTDIYSMGVMLYHLLTGRLPFEGEDYRQVVEEIRSKPPPPPSAFAPSVPSELDRVILCAMSKNPQDRFESAGAMSLALEGVLAAEEERGRRRGGLRSVLALAGTGMLAAAAAVLLSGRAPRNEPKPRFAESGLEAVRIADLSRRPEWLQVVKGAAFVEGGSLVLRDAEVRLVQGRCDRILQGRIAVEAEGNGRLEVFCDPEGPRFAIEGSGGEWWLVDPVGTRRDRVEAGDTVEFRFGPASRVEVLGRGGMDCQGTGGGPKEITVVLRATGVVRASLLQVAVRRPN